MSLRIKVLVILSLICLGGGYSGYRWVYNNMRPQFLRVMEDGMVDHAYLLARIIEASLPDKGPKKAFKYLHIGKVLTDIRNSDIRARIYEWEKRKLNFRIYVTDAQGIVRFDSDGGRTVGRDYSRWNDIYKALRGKYGARSSREKSSRGAIINSLYAAFPMYKKDAKGRKELIGVLSLAKSKSSLAGWALRAQSRLWQGVLLGAFALFLLALLATQTVLQPIFRLTQYARNVAAGRRVSPPNVGHDEIGVLTQSFIEMKEALLQRQDIESFVTQLTHELKSPISAIQGAAELLEDPQMPPHTRDHFLQNIQDQTLRMNDIVQRLLTLVSLEQRQQLDKRESIHLHHLVDELQERFRPQAQQKKISLHTHIHIDTPSHIDGERFLLGQALANLLQNSLHFTPPHGEITLTVKLQPELKHIDFSIRDTGPGIPEYALSRVTERFYSLEHPDTSQKGTGLGLPFVKQIALLHGGDFTIQNHPQKGALAHLWLPLQTEE